MPVKALASAPSTAIIPRLTLGPARPLMRRSHVVALLSLIPVSVIADSLFTGLGFRDTFGRRRVLETGKYSQITFTIDSVVDVQPGDTLRAVAFGTVELHGVQRATRAPLVAWHEPAGFRVHAQFSVPALALTNEFKMSKVALGMGVIMRRWNTVHMGVDVVLRPTGS